MDLFNAHANGLAVYTEGQETQLLFLLKRPFINEKGEINVRGEEQALITVSFEYAKTIADALYKNIEEHIKKQKENGGD